ncbi:MAG: glycoside hydrolase [Spirochaetales bacterium]|nr:glycoside hydrolase [Spirochaetales bacterium]
MKTRVRKFQIIAILILSVLIFSILSGCSTFNDAEAVESEQNNIIYLNLTWHQHQPLYYEDPDTGVVTRPWVRVHATKDYYDMVSILREYPEIHVTFNLTPVLLLQIDAYRNGTKDLYWVLAEKPAGELNTDEKRFILERFFDANWNNMIRKFPRYSQLLAKRGDGSPESVENALTVFTEQDFRDLQIWFNLAWFDPDFLTDEPLMSLVRKGENFTESDKTIIFDVTLDVLNRIVPEHRELQDAGQIEVITTPYAHPILPLVYNSDLGEKGDPTSDMPERFSFPNDAINHLRISVERYLSDFGREPSGLWPAEGSVGQDIIRIVSEAGFKWMASGEQVLAASLGIPGFTRNSYEIVDQADELYRPYIVRDQKSGSEMYMVFRDLRISDLVGFEYSGTPAERAAQDFIDRIEAIRLQLKESGEPGPHLVSVILDGENAWEHYPNDGREFLHALYRKLEESSTIKTTTVSLYIEKYPEQREIEELWWGSWFTPDYSTWIGEDEENTAWEYLLQTREMLAKYDIAGRKQTTEESLNAALDAMYLAEGSDWFWWYGADQDSGVDEYFDEAYRALLRKVYEELDEEVPAFISVPIIPERPASPVKTPEGIFVPVIDGIIHPVEWELAGYFSRSGGAMARAEDVLEKLYYGWDKDSFYFGAVSREEWGSLTEDGVFTLYFSLPGQEDVISLSEGDTPLGFGAGYKIEFYRTPQGTSMELYTVGLYNTWEKTDSTGAYAVSGKNLEFSLPFNNLPAIQPGDQFYFRAYLNRGNSDISPIPADGPARVIMPNLLDSEPVMAVNDAVGDDYGPGTYVYPTDTVFIDGAFDILSFTAAENEDYYLFSYTLDAPIQNPWGSGVGLSIQTFDIYIDIDPGAGTGREELLEGRNASLQEGNGWDYAVWVEGWSQKLIGGLDDQSLAEVSGTPVKVLVDAEKGKVTILVKRDAMTDAGPVENWGVAAVVLGQEGYPSPGVRRVRDIQESASQWKFGGADIEGEKDPTRIIDLVVPGDADWNQEDVLADGKIPLILSN